MSGKQSKKSKPKAKKFIAYVYFHSCVTREIEADSYEDAHLKLEGLVGGITDEEIKEGMQLEPAPDIEELDR